MSKDKNFQFFDKSCEEFFFSLINNTVTCLLCGLQPSVVKKFALRRHYNRKHVSEYSQYVDREKHNLIEGLKLVHQEGSSPISSSSVDSTPSVKALTASYVISNHIAQNSKPFTEGQFVKECLILAIESFGTSITLEQAASIPLSRNTVKSRIDDIASSVENKVKSLLASCSYFSLCLDESTDNRHVSQLSIFARIVQNDFSHVEELLDFVPLRRATGLDIFKAVTQTLKKFDVDFSKCSAITTDGAKAMIGSKNGFFGQLKQRGFKFPVIHCIIHQEALCGKVVKLSTAMRTVTKIINFIRGGHKFLSHRQFQHFLEEHDATYKDLPLYCEIRWLSAGKCLQHFFAIRKEIYLFLQQQIPEKIEEFMLFFEDIDSLCELAFITDITNHLNNLNLNLQKTNQTILQLFSHVNSFRRKLKVIENQLKNNVFSFFPSCQTLLEEYDTKCNFSKQINIIDSLISQFNTRFIDFEALRKDLLLFENPLTVQIEEQSLQFQAELCDLQCDLSLESQQKTGVEFFKILDISSYPRLKDLGLRIFSMFGSTYLCECSFSKMNSIKTENRSSLSDKSLSSLMRTSSSKISVDIESLIKSFKQLKRCE